MKIKEIKEQLQTKEIEFNIKGHKSYQKGPDGEYGDYPTIFRTHGCNRGGENDAIFKGFSNGMNITKFGPTCITLYTYDMLSKKTVGKIKYEDVTILESKEDEK